MKKVVIIVLTAAILLGGAAAAGFYMGFFSPGQKTGKEVSAPSTSPSPARTPLPPATTPAVTPTPAPPTSPPTLRPTLPPAAIPTPVPPTVAPTLASTSAPTASVDFQIAITGLTGTGLSRTVNAQIANDGTAEAHNVWVKSEVFSQQQKIQLSGQDSLRVDVGTIKAGTTITSQANLSFNLLDGLRIQQNGARFVLTVNSDERTQTLNYDYTP